MSWEHLLGIWGKMIFAWYLPARADYFGMPWVEESEND